MPQYSNSSAGNYSVTVPANATNVKFFLAGAGGGNSVRTPPGTSWNNTGGWGRVGEFTFCLLYTSDAAADTPCVDLRRRRINKKK